MAKILIAEHNESTAEYLSGKLKKGGHTIDVVDNCLDAWRSFSKETFDVLLIDIVMPGVDGFVLAQKALQDNPALQIIFITGFAGVAMDTYSTPAYAPAPITTRPFHLREISSRIRFLMGQGGLPLQYTSSASGNTVVYADFSRKADSQQHLMS